MRSVNSEFSFALFTSVWIPNFWSGAPCMSVFSLSEGVPDGRSSREVMRHVSLSDGVYQYHVFCDCCRAGETVCVDSDHLFSVVNRFTFAKVVSSSPNQRCKVIVSRCWTLFQFQIRVLWGEQRVHNVGNRKSSFFYSWKKYQYRYLMIMCDQRIRILTKLSSFLGFSMWNGRPWSFLFSTINVGREGR